MEKDKVKDSPVSSPQGRFDHPNAEEMASQIKHHEAVIRASLPPTKEEFVAIWEALKEKDPKLFEARKHEYNAHLKLY